MSLLQTSLEFSVQAHRYQLREGEPDMPYAVHPVEVCCILRYQGNVTDETILAAALLHDTLEETDTEVEDLEERFGRHVTELVLELTRSEPTPEQTEGLSKGEIYELRNSIMLSEIAQMSAPAKTVKLADRISNLREARVTRDRSRLDRYILQSQQILQVIPEQTHPVLWHILDSLAAETASHLRTR